MKIGVVLVTYNRLDKLKLALRSYEEQTLKPEYILVVNNNSNDGTKEYLSQWEKVQVGFRKEVLNLPSNSGGSGGFYEGFKKILSVDVDWVWVSDDDAYPEANAFEKIHEYIKQQRNGDEEISAVCGAVLRGDGITIDYSHRRNIYQVPFNRIVQPYSRPKDYIKQAFEINVCSYVGTMINMKKLRQTELIKKEYFIYYDDTDHSYRLSKLGKIICIPEVRVIHDAPHSEMSEIVKWKLYYLVRNTLDFVRSNFGEKVFREQCLEVPFVFKVAVFLFGKDKKYGYKMINEAVKDAKLGKTGLHEIYRPGWDPHQNNARNEKTSTS